jgi:malate dehydrogenase (oxaloacetate-decarboxylating)
MLIAGTQALAYLSPALSDPDASLLPDFQDSRKANIAVAIAVAEEAFDEGLVDVEWKKEEVRERVLKGMWDAHYGEYVYDKDGES